MLIAPAIKTYQSSGFLPVKGDPRPVPDFADQRERGLERKGQGIQRDSLFHEHKRLETLDELLHETMVDDEGYGPGGKLLLPDNRGEFVDLYV